MKKLFYFGILGLILFEIANVYFIMPLPGSQRINSIDLAYFLHTWRWVFRGIFGFMVLAGGLSAIKKLLLPIVVIVETLHATSLQRRRRRR